LHLALLVLAPKIPTEAKKCAALTIDTTVYAHAGGCVGQHRAVMGARLPCIACTDGKTGKTVMGARFPCKHAGKTAVDACLDSRCIALYWALGIALYRALHRALGMALYRALGPPVAEASTAPGRRTQIELAVSIAWRWPIVVAGSIELAVSIAWRWPIVVAGSIELAVSIAWRWPIVVAGRTELAVSIAWGWPIVVAGSIELAVCAAVASRWPIVVAGRWPVVRRVALTSAAAAIESRAAGAASCSGNERGEGSAS